jgi:hypothetical protein
MPELQDHTRQRAAPVVRNSPSKNQISESIWKKLCQYRSAIEEDPESYRIKLVWIKKPSPGQFLIYTGASLTKDQVKACGTKIGSYEARLDSVHSEEQSTEYYIIKLVKDPSTRFWTPGTRSERHGTGHHRNASPHDRRREDTSSQSPPSRQRVSRRSLRDAMASLSLRGQPAAGDNPPRYTERDEGAEPVPPDYTSDDPSGPPPYDDDSFAGLWPRARSRSSSRSRHISPPLGSTSRSHRRSRVPERLLEPSRLGRPSRQEYEMGEQRSPMPAPSRRRRHGRERSSRISGDYYVDYFSWENPSDREAEEATRLRRHRP